MNDRGESDPRRVHRPQRTEALGCYCSPGRLFEPGSSWQGITSLRSACDPKANTIADSAIVAQVDRMSKLVLGVYLSLGADIGSRTGHLVGQGSQNPYPSY